MNGTAARFAALRSETRTLVRAALYDRRTPLYAGAAGIVVLLGVAALAIGTGDFTLVALLLGAFAAPFLVLLALTRPFIFPYGLFVLMVPFDNMLRIGAAGTLTKLVGALSIVALIVLAFRKRTAHRPPLAVVVAAAFVFWMLLSSLWAVDIGYALIDVQTMFSLVLMLVVLSMAPAEERDVRAICLAIVLGGVGAAIYGIAYFHNAPPGAEAEGRLMMTVGGRSIDPNDFANSLLMPFSLALVGLLHARRPHVVVAALIALAILGEAILITLSREALLGCFAVGMVVVFMSRRRLLALAVFVPALVAVPLIVPGLLDRILTAASTGGAGRTSIWQVDLHAWLVHPVIGWGAGSAFQAYSANLLAVAPRLFAGWDRPPHNTPLHLLVDLGIVGLALCVLSYFLVLRGLRSISRGDALYGIRVALTASLIALAVVSLFIDNGNDKYVWLALGTAVQLRVVARTRPAPAPAIVYEPPVVARTARRFAH